MPLDLSLLPDPKPPMGIDLSKLPDTVESLPEPLAEESKHINTDLIHSELLNINPGLAVIERDNINAVLKDRSNLTTPEKDAHNKIKTGIEQGNYGALIPLLGLSAFRGLTQFIFKPLGIATGMRTDKLIDEAIEYWRQKSPDIKFVDPGIERPEAKPITSNAQALLGWLTDWEIQRKQGSVRDIAAGAAELTGFAGGPLRVAGTAGQAVVAATAKTARPVYQSIYRGMSTGALLGEGDKEKTLEHMALFGVFEGLTGFLGRIARTPERVANLRQWHEMSSKERAHIMRSMDELATNAEKTLDSMKKRGASKEAVEAMAEKLDSEIFKKVEDPFWRQEQIDRPIEGMEPVEVVREKPVKPKEEVSVVYDGKDFFKVEPTKPPEPKPVKPTVPEPELYPIPDEPIPPEAIDTYQKLAGEAERGAIEGVKGKELKEEKKILTEAKKEAMRMVRESPAVEVVADIVDRGGLNRESVIASGVSKPEIADLNRRHPKLITNKGPIKADLEANRLGFDTADELLENIKRTPGIGEASERLTQEFFDEAMIGIDEGRAYDLRERLLDEEINLLSKALGKKPKIRRDLKGVIRRESGQEKAKDILEVDTRKALNDQLKLEAKAAREAFSAGKKESALAHKIKQREITIRAREAKRSRDTINRIIKDFKKTQKKLSPKSLKKMGGFPPEQASEIRELLSGLDLAKPTAKTLKKLQATRKYLNENPNALMPDSVLAALERLEKVSVRDLELNDLESIHQAVMHQVKLGELKNRIKVGRARKDFFKTLDTAIRELELPKDLIDKFDEIITDAEVSRKTAGKWIRDNLMIRQDGYDLIVETIAGPDSVVYDVFFRQPKFGVRKKIQKEQEFYDLLNKLSKDAGFDPVVFVKRPFRSLPKGKTDINKWVNETVKTGRFELTRGRRISLYLHSLNPDNYEALVTGGFGLRFGTDPAKVYKISEEELQEIIESLDKNELALAQATSELMGHIGNQIEPVFKDQYGYDFPRVDPYYPKDVMPLERGALDAEAEEMLARTSERWARPGIPKGRLEKRIGSKLPIYIEPVTDVINKQIDWASTFIGLEGPLNNASKLLYNNEYRKALSAKYGDNTVWKEIDKGLKDVAGLHEAVSSLEQMLSVVRARVATTTLGANPFVIALQALSYPMYVRYVPPEHMLQGALEFWKNPNQSIARLKRISPKFRKRLEGGFNKDLAELSRMTANVQLGGKKDYASQMMGGIKGVDAITVGTGMQGAINFVMESLERGIVTPEMEAAIGITAADIPKLTPEAKLSAAVIYAEFVTDTTQPTFDALHRSPISRGGGVEKTISMYSSFTNRALNMIRRDWRSYQRAKTKAEKDRALNAFVATLLLIGVVNTTGLELRDRARDFLYGRKTKEKNLALRIVKHWSGLLLLIRDIVSSGVSIAERGSFLGYDVSFPVEKGLQVPANVMGHGLRAITADKKKERKRSIIKFADAVTELYLMKYGLPYQNLKNLKRIGENILE